jgi:hypothetical protein
MGKKQIDFYHKRRERHFVFLLQYLRVHLAILAHFERRIQRYRQTLSFDESLLYLAILGNC